MTLLTAPEVAARLGYSLSYYRKRWRRWRRELGFPAPTIGFRWDSEAIDAWIASRRLPDAMEVGAPERPRGGRPRSLNDEDRRRQAERNLDSIS